MATRRRDGIRFCVFEGACMLMHACVCLCVCECECECECDVKPFFDYSKCVFQLLSLLWVATQEDTMNYDRMREIGYDHNGCREPARELGPREGPLPRAARTAASEPLVCASVGTVFIKLLFMFSAFKFGPVRT